MQHAVCHDGVLCGAGECGRVLVKKCVHVYANMSYKEAGSVFTWHNQCVPYTVRNTLAMGDNLYD